MPHRYWVQHNHKWDPSKEPACVVPQNKHQRKPRGWTSAGSTKMSVNNVLRTSEDRTIDLNFVRWSSLSCWTFQPSHTGHQDGSTTSAALGCGQFHWEVLVGPINRFFWETWWNKVKHYIWHLDEKCIFCSLDTSPIQPNTAKWHHSHLQLHQILVMERSWPFLGAVCSTLSCQLLPRQ